MLAGAIRIELISLVLETKAQPLYQTPKQHSYYITKKIICQLFFTRKQYEILEKERYLGFSMEEKKKSMTY